MSEPTPEKLKCAHELIGRVADRMVELGYATGARLNHTAGYDMFWTPRGLALRKGLQQLQAEFGKIVLPLVLDIFLDGEPIPGAQDVESP